jgi:hypothetical protein
MELFCVRRNYLFFREYSGLTKQKSNISGENQCRNQTFFFTKCFNTECPKRYTTPVSLFETATWTHISACPSSESAGPQWLNHSGKLPSVSHPSAHSSIVSMPSQ